VKQDLVQENCHVDKKKNLLQCLEFNLIALSGFQNKIAKEPKVPKYPV
jgi:hypothetical protein